MPACAGMTSSLLIPLTLTPIKAARDAAIDARTSIHSRGAVMSSVAVFYLGVVLFAFVGFAVSLAYYSHR
jgi:hypothetical protein